MRTASGVTACVGIDRQETSREISFCAYNIYDHELLVVEDATEDQRFKDRLLVARLPGVRFYAGVPSRAPERTHRGLPLRE